MAKPVRIQRKRTKGWTMPLNTAYVGRGSDWGNPHKALTRDALGRAHAVIQFRQYCPPKSPLAAAARRILRGKNLACWCPLDQPCHADVLLELANSEASE
ncbi:DUF4326 domain-containing protein [Afipia carboxidovorans]|uniref:DUF4326 domain-containing protein n=1 Tax=Afipia carboxidovorans TaxID=40137 RepID=UPI0030895D85|nr:DUF4326 domain-containing protein [Afipia carboxidovorans]